MAKSFKIDFLFFKAKKTFMYLEKFFIKAMILEYFDLKYYIYIKTNILRYVISKVFNYISSLQFFLLM